jgi:Zn-finger nucleic acid-binding protein
MWDYIIKNLLKKETKESSDISKTKPIFKIESYDKNKINVKDEHYKQDFLSLKSKHKTSYSNTRILNCPICNIPMERKIFPLSKVEIDECPKCKGIFLDKGELQEIMGIDIKISQKNKAFIVYSPKGINKIDE